MSRPSESGRGLPVALAGLVLAPVCALAGVTLGGGAAEPARTGAPGAYQIRCWQHGRLLFEDRITLPADAAAYGIRLSGTDRWGRPLYVADTRNATCLVRIASDEPAWPPR